MESLEFLTAVLPSQGKYCTFTMRDKLRKNLFVDDLQNLYDTNLKLSGLGNNTFYALASFDASGTREAAHAQSMRSLFMDLDCGEGKAFPNKKAAIAALQAFLEATFLDTLGLPWLVDSGGGVHVYWPLSEDLAIEHWKPLAEGMKRLAKQHAFPIDMTVTADAARVLRMPGTMNWKYEPPRPVLLRHRGATFHRATLVQILDANSLASSSAGLTKPPSTALVIPGKPPSTALTPAAKAMMGNSATFFKNILVKTVNGAGCNQLKHYIDNASKDGMEPIWRGLLSWAKVCDDGDKAARKLSAMHPYDEERMLQKLSEIKGPYACYKMDTENPGVCDECPNRGKFTNPLVLGREVQTVTEATTIAVPQEDEDAPQVIVERPEPPKDFEYGRTSGVFYRKKSDKEDEPDKLVMLTPYDFFMTRMFSDGPVHTAEFKVIKGDKIFTFAVPTETVAKMDSCIKVLATNNVLAANSGCDMYLYHYVRQSVNAASAAGTSVPVPPRFGWQDDGNFAVHDTVYSARGPAYDYKFVSNRIANLISATESCGTVEGYAEMVHMMRRKAADNPIIWGHLALIGAGLGSILMHFTPHGSRAATLHVCSTSSGSGKSIAQSMSASAWGDPKRYMVAASTSERTMMQRASLLGSLPLIMDEVTKKIRANDRSWLPDLLFDYSAGMHKIKGSATGNTEIQHDALWTGICLVSSNAPMLEAMMGARKHTSEGEARRHLEWQLPEKFRMSWSAEERRIRDLMATNYGVAGPMFARWCVTHQDKVQDVINRVYDHWVQISEATDDERFWTAKAVSIIAAFLLAGPKYANIINVPTLGIIEFLLALVKRHRKIIAGNQRTALDVLNAYTAEHIGGFVKTEGSHVMQNLLGGQAVQAGSARFAVKGRVEYNVVPGHVDYFIEVRALKLHCADHSMSYELFFKELQALERTTVQPCRKNLLAGTKGADMKVNCLRITRTIEDAEADDK